MKIALDLFSSKGYSGTKISDIARRADMSIGALYLRFKSKEELCLGLIKDQTRDFCKYTKNLKNKDPLEGLKTYIKYAFQKGQTLSLIIIREHKLPFIQPLKRKFFNIQHKIIEDILATGVKKGIFKPMDIKDTASLIFACIMEATALKLVYGVGEVNAMSNSLFQLITNGIGNVKSFTKKDRN